MKYEILVKCFTTMVVDADNKEHALEVASDNFNSGKFELDEMSIESELPDPASVERAIRHSEYHRLDFKKTPYTAD